MDIDLRKYGGEVRNQNGTGLCHSFVAAEMLNVFYNSRYKPDQNIEFSPYYIANILKENKIVNQKEEGCELYNALQVVKDYGCVSINRYGEENYLPFEVPGMLKNSPKIIGEIYSKKVILGYKRARTVDEIKKALEEGRAIGLSILVYENFMDTREVIEMPKGNPMGKHAITIMGYKEGAGFIIKNSYGASWGLGGYSYMSEDYLETDCRLFGHYMRTFEGQAYHYE